MTEKSSNPKRNTNKSQTNIGTVKQTMLRDSDPSGVIIALAILLPNKINPVCTASDLIRTEPLLPDSPTVLSSLIVWLGVPVSSQNVGFPAIVKILYER